MLRAVIAAVLAGTSASALAQPASPFIPDGAASQAPRGFVEMCREDATFCAPSPEPGDDAMVTAAILPSNAVRRAAWAAPALAEIVFTVAGRGGDEARWTVPAWQATATGVPVAPAAMPWVRALPTVAPAVELSAPARPFELLRRVNVFVNGRVAQRTDYQVYNRDEYWHRSGSGRGAAGDCEDLAIEKRFELVAAGFPADKLAFAVAYLPRIGLHAVLIARTADGDMVLDSRTPYVKRWDRTAYSWVSIQSMDAPMAWHSATPPRVTAPLRYVSNASPSTPI